MILLFRNPNFKSNLIKEELFMVHCEWKELILKPSHDIDYYYHSWYLHP